MNREKTIENLYLSIDDKRRPFESRIMREAIKLLKADAPRVLSLEELMGFDGAFLIEYNKSLVSLDPIWATFHFMDEKWVFLYKNVVIAHYSVEQYGRTWRCWSRRPDPEQMEAAPWRTE